MNFSKKNHEHLKINKNAVSKKLILLLITIFFFNQAYADIWLPSILSDNMVIQQQSEVAIWGWTTNANETITVVGSWNGQEVATKAYQGVWSLKINTPKAGGTYTITIKGHEEIFIKNVLIGEVWLGSGQSNMEWTAKRGIDNAEEEVAKANFPEIRFFTVLKHKSETPQDQVIGKWVVCTPETMKTFSAVAYYFGRQLHNELKVPVGLINSSWGGTVVEIWMKNELIMGDNDLKESAKKIGANPHRPNKPADAYNAMIHPILNFNIAGVIWYQGESNRLNAISYYKTFPLLISSWRKDFDKDLPFYFVQIAPYKYDNPKGLSAAVIRDAQLKTMLTVPNTGMVVVNDIGNLENIHPQNKLDVGDRLARWALAKNYNKTDVVVSGPIYKSMEIKKRKMILSFDYASSGLKQKGKQLEEFYIAGADQKFYPAKAKIVNNTIIVTAREVKKPIAVRFAFTNGALPNLFNNEGLPASAFRTDNWKLNLE